MPTGFLQLPIHPLAHPPGRAALGFAAAWEDFCGSLACEFVRDSSDTATKLFAVWSYTAITLVICLPAVLVIRPQAESAKAEAEKNLLDYQEAIGKASQK